MDLTHLLAKQMLAEQINELAKMGHSLFRTEELILKLSQEYKELNEYVLERRYSDAYQDEGYNKLSLNRFISYSSSRMFETQHLVKEFFAVYNMLHHRANL